MKKKTRLSMYSLALLLMTTCVTVTAGTTALAAGDWRWPYPRRAAILTREQDNRLQQFLRNHRDVYRDLERNPELANDWHYLRRHDDFREFLSDHPGIRAAFRTDPFAVMRPLGHTGPRRTWDHREWRREHYR